MVIKKGEKMRSSKPKKVLSPKELELKQYKKEFRFNEGYFKFLKKLGNNASKDFKQAKKLLKKGDVKGAKLKIAKYTIMDITAYAKLLKK